jgi:hypothetical protein
MISKKRFNLILSISTADAGHPSRADPRTQQAQVIYYVSNICTLDCIDLLRKYADNLLCGYYFLKVFCYSLNKAFCLSS